MRHRDAADIRLQSGVDLIFDTLNPNPPVHHEDPAFRRLAEQRKRQLWRRRLYWSAGVLALVALLGFGARPAGRAIKAWQSRRVARQASELIEHKQWNEAAAKTRDALQLRQTEPEAWRVAAQLATRQGQPAIALGWWAKLNEVNQLSPDNRREYAKAAMAAGQLTTAGTQIDVLLSQKEGPTVADLLLAAQLSGFRGDNIHSRDYAERAMADERAKPNQIFEAAFVVLSTTQRESPEYAEAWLRMVRLARGDDNSTALRALLLLAQQPALAFLPPPGKTAPLSIALPGTSSQESQILFDEIADRIEGNPGARPADRLFALGLRIRQDPSRTEEYINQAVERFGKGNDDDVAALASWLQGQQRSETVLQILPLDRSLKRRDLFLKRIDALSALGRWQELKDLLNSERFPLEPVLQQMYLAAASAKLGEISAESNAWQRALEAADSAEKCMTVGSYAERNGAFQIADAAYSRAIQITPALRAAHDARFQLAIVAGQTAKAEEISAAMIKLWPEDAALRKENAYLRLLLGAAPADAETIRRDIEPVVLQEPWNWDARTTLALACLRAGRPAAALEAFTRAPGSPTSSRARTVRAAALAANGWVDDAKKQAGDLTASNLLPEERALIAPLLAGP